ncbi:MAG: hypothetical protein GY820_01840 [Gammaproteobacteria bacterium]|nr:hypothetical protein [Gammaproteobacteria bacterium]
MRSWKQLLFCCCASDGESSAGHFDPLVAYFGPNWLFSRGSNFGLVQIMAPVTLACSECSASETDSPSARASWFSCDACHGCICFKCVVGIASADRKFVLRVVEGLKNSAVLSKTCKSCRNRSSLASSAASECGVEEHESSVMAEIATLNTTVKGIAKKLEQMQGEIHAVKGTVAEGATDSQALVSFFGTPLKTYSAVLKNGLKNETVSGPKPKAPTIQGQLPGLSRPMEEVREDVAAHKKSLIVIGLPEKEWENKDEKDPDVIALDNLFADCGSPADFEYDYERLGRKRRDGSTRVLKVDFDSVARVNSILAGKRNLKGKEQWAKVRIRRSLPLAERQALRLCFCRAAQLMASRKERNEEEDVVYFVLPDAVVPRVHKRAGDKVDWFWIDSELEE